MEEMKNKIKAVVIGHAIGDALGVPVEFCERDELVGSYIVDRNFRVWCSWSKLALVVFTTPTRVKT